jgi:DNA-binding transcriptional regulator YdaS (Cro superfamily)
MIWVMHTKTETPLDRAIQIAGGPTAMARTMNLSGHQVVYQWKQTRVPAEYCPEIERLYKVPCEELRPDVNWAVLREQPAIQVPVTQITEA